MNKKVILFLIASFIGSCAVFGLSPEESIRAADAQFETGKYNEALKSYESAFEAGLFSEAMLYRLAFMNENLRNFPQAIFYLKKIQKEYGGKFLNQKVVQLLQKNGSTRYLSEDPWTTYALNVKSYLPVIWVVVFLSFCWLVFYILYQGEPQKYFGMLNNFMIPLFILGFMVLGHYFFLFEQRAVLVKQSAFYSFPSYGAKYETESLSTGETVTILDKSDIWLYVEAGNSKVWIPRKVVRIL